MIFYWYPQENNQYFPFIFLLPPPLLLSLSLSVVQWWISIVACVIRCFFCCFILIFIYPFLLLWLLLLLKISMLQLIHWTLESSINPFLNTKYWKKILILCFILNQIRFFNIAMATNQNQNWLCNVNLFKYYAIIHCHTYKYIYIYILVIFLNYKTFI